MQDDVTAAALIARMLRSRGVERVFGLCGGHIMPLWMALDAERIAITDVRDERSAVYMAHANAAVTGCIGVALVTAGPGVTNAMTGIANAHVSRIPVLVLSGTPPMSQENRGALQDMSHVAIVTPITRYARTVRHCHAIVRELDAALAAAAGHVGEPGPAFLDLPVDIQTGIVPAPLGRIEQIGGVPRPRVRPMKTDLDAAAQMIRDSRRPLVISGRGANAAPDALSAFLTASGAAYLDTGETKGIVPETHPAHIGAMRARAMSEADLVITIGRKLDFQLAYGSPAVYRDARFLRMSDTPQELFDNRLGAALLGDLPDMLQSLTLRLQVPQSDALLDRSWLQAMREGHARRTEKLLAALATPPSDPSEPISPNGLLGAIRRRLPPDAVVVADGGDFLSFARVALSPRRYLDPGPLGCIGIATPFAMGAALGSPGQQVVAVTGDGAFGFTAIEVDTVVRHKVALMIVVGNNGSWAIEVRDQQDRFGKVVGTRLQHANHAKLAEAFGMAAFRVESAGALDLALDAAFDTLAQGKPVLIDVLIADCDPSSDSRSGLARVPDLQAVDAWDEAERRWLGLLERDG